MTEQERLDAEHTSHEDLEASARQRLEHIRQTLDDDAPDIGETIKRARRARLELMKQTIGARARAAGRTIRRTIKRRGRTAFTELSHFYGKHALAIVAGLGAASYVAGKLIGDRVLKDD